MSKIRVKFTRVGDVKYISHLDLMKFFDRALRRANIPIAYSQGFNPHPQMVFGLPLAVGTTSEAEFADFQLASEMKPEEFMAALNAQLPEGMRITKASILNSKDNIMKVIAAASYEVSCTLNNKFGFSEISQIVNNFMRQPSIVAEKEAKGKVKLVDIKPLIIDIRVVSAESDSSLESCFSVETNNNKVNKNAELNNGNNMNNTNEMEYSKANKVNVKISMLLKAGNEANIKPGIVIAALNNICNINLMVTGIHRTGLYVLNKGAFIDPLDPAATNALEGDKNAK